MPNDLVSVHVKAVIPTANGSAVFLGNESKAFVIYVDHHVGAAIQSTLDGVKKERPQTHDLIGTIFLGLGVVLDYIVINDAKEGTFYARIFLKMENELGKKILEIDARPSDSIVLALQARRPISVSKSVFDRVEDMTDYLEQALKQQADLEDNFDEEDEDEDEEGDISDT
jgi:hypothetical protein